MEITWFGHSCFRITERGQTAVVCDPYDSELVGYQPLKLKADIVTISHENPSHSYLKGVKGDPYVIKGPGEYEVGGVFITGLRTDMRKKRDPNQPVNTLYLIDFGGINIVHLGDMLQVPTQAEVESLGPVHIALVPVGGNGSLTAANASEAISLFEPNIVIPMHYQTPQTSIKLDPIGKFLKEMGLSEVETMPSLKIANVASLPEETQVIVLDFPHDQQEQEMPGKLIMTWDINPEHEQEYFEFVVREFLPHVQRLGFQMSDAWVTVYGEQPQIMVGATLPTIAEINQVLRSEEWDALIVRLLDYVTDFKYKIVSATGGFQF